VICDFGKAEYFFRGGIDTPVAKQPDETGQELVIFRS
jgi:hypothetical protein